MIRLVVVLLGLIPPFAACAATFSVESAVAYALRQNRDLAAARFGIEEARGRWLQSGRFSNPEVESELKPNVRGREFSLGVGFVQKFPLTNRLRLEKAVTRAELAAAEAEVEEAARKLAADVRAAAVKLLALKAQKALKAEQIANSRKMAEVATKTAQVGEGSTLEATQFELETQQLAVETLQLDAEKAALVGELRPLLAVGSAETVEISGSLSEPVSIAKAVPNLAGRPDYLVALSKIEAARQNVLLQRKNKWADAGVGIATEVERSEDAPEGLQTDGFIGLKFTLPLPLWNKNEGRIKEAEATAARTEAEGHALAGRIRAEAAAARDEMAAAARIYKEVSSNLLPNSRKLEERLLSFYQTAQPGTLLTDVLRSREKRLLLEGLRLNALRDYHLARSRHAAAVGRPPSSK